MDHTPTTFRSLDGLRLEGTLVAPAGELASVSPTVLVHGGGVTREEGGFFTRLAEGLAEAGSPTLRFDLRAHGESGGRMEELTLSGVVNDIRAAVEHVQERTGGAVNVLGASFGGGLSAFFAARYPDRVRRLVLINPLIDYKRRFIDDKPHWRGEHLDDAAADRLTNEGAIPHSANVRHGRAMLNELFYVRPDLCLEEVRAPALIVHGTADTFIAVESSREAAPRFGGGAELVEVEGMQHGVAMPEDPQYLHPQTQEWQAGTISRIAKWLAA